MGEYYNWVNINKKEYLIPSDFDLGSKWNESRVRGNALLCALKELLNERWKGDYIAFLGDDFFVTENESNDFLKELYNQTVAYGVPGNIYSVICDEYRNVSCLFEAAEKQVREEIMFFLEDYNNGVQSLLNEYGVNVDKPFEHLFEKKGQDFIYTVNYSKKVCYSFENTRILDSNQNEYHNIDPLPMLMGYGRVLNVGLWVGDIIGFTNDKPKDFIVLKKIYVD